MFEALSVLGPGETIAFVIAVATGLTLSSKYAFSAMSSGQGSRQSDKEVDSRELQQLVREAVEDATEPLERRIETLERIESLEEDEKQRLKEQERRRALKEPVDR